MPKGVYKHKKQIIKNLGEGMKGKHQSEEHKKKIGFKNSISLKNRKLSEEHKINIGKGVLKRKEKLGYINSPGSRRKMREAKINNPNKVFKNTSIELKIEEELKRRNINYQKQVPLCKIAIVDFYLPEYRIVIQCDGDYWHNLSGYKERDENQDRVLTFNGFNVYRFWEHEINKSVENCFYKIKLIK